MAVQLLSALRSNLGLASTGHLSTVPGFVTGDKLLDWKVTGWNWASEPIPEGDLVNAYDSGTTFPMTFEFVEGSRGGAYRQYNGRTGSGKISVTPNSFPYGASVSILSSSVLNTTTGHDCEIQVIGAANLDVSLSTGAWFRDYSYPSQPGGLTAEVIRFTAGINNNSVTGEDVLNWDLVYTMSSFNDSLIRNQHSKFKRRSATNSDYSFRWYSDSGYSNLIATGTICDVTQSFAPQDLTVYLEYKRVDAGSYTQTSVFFDDPREDA